MSIKILSQLTHRGPDDGYIFAANNVMLGVRRLAIINVTRGSQPAFSNDKNLTAVFNGEIYNHVELKQELERDGFQIRDGSDVEVIPHAYQKWGVDFCSHFNGEFAIALWDQKKQELILARDRVGIKPLFFTITPRGELVFGSEIKAIFANPNVPRKLNKQTIGQIFTFWTAVDSFSPFENIHQLESGTVYRFDRNLKLVEKYRYWDIPHSDGKTKFIDKFADCKAAFRDEMRNAVSLRLRADVDIGTYTSGGIDSSVINYIAYKELGHSQTQTFSVAFKDAYYDESRYQEILANYLGLNHNSIIVSESDIYNNFERAIYHTESPIFRTAPIPMMLLSQKVRDKKIKVVLTGEGSDEAIWGYDIYRETKVRKFWSRNPSSSIRPQLFRRLYSYLPQFQDKRYFNMTLDFFKKGLQELDDPFYSHITRISNSMATHSFFSNAMKQQLADHHPLQTLKQSLPSDYFARSMLEKCQYLEMNTLLNGYLLSSQGDRMLSANSIEGRFPFLDHNVIEFLAKIPEKFKVCGLRDKHILRETYNDYLPKELAYRPKFAYRAPEMQAFVKDEYGYVAKLLSKESLDRAGIFDPGTVEGLKTRMKTLKTERFTTRDNLAFVQILSTQQLQETFVDNLKSHEQPSRNDFTIVRT